METRAAHPANGRPPAKRPLADRPIDPAGLRRWVRNAEARMAEMEGELAELKRESTAHHMEGLPFAVRMRANKQPLTQEQLAARMVANGADPVDAMARAGIIIGTHGDR